MALVTSPEKPRSLADTPRAVLFTPASRGQLALVIFEWEDASHLGIDKNGQSTENEWSDEVRRGRPRL